MRAGNRAWAAIALVVTALLLAGCTSAIAGSPTAAGEPQRTEEPAEDESSNGEPTDDDSEETTGESEDGEPTPSPGPDGLPRDDAGICAWGSSTFGLVTLLTGSLAISEDPNLPGAIFPDVESRQGVRR